MNVIIVTGVGDFAMQVRYNEPVIEVKQRIEQLFGVPVSNQTLTAFGFELFDGLDMEDYPIVMEGTKVNLAISHFLVPPPPPPPLPPPPPTEKLRIKAKISRRWLNIEVDRTETVKGLKEKIHIIDGVPLKRVTLIFSGIEMKEDHRYLCEYGICDQSEIIVNHKNVASLRSEPTARILSFVVQTSSNLLDSAKIPLQMKDSSTIAELKRRLLDEKILPRDDYFFIHKQRIMQDNGSLRWHGIENGDHLYVFKGVISYES